MPLGPPGPKLVEHLDRLGQPLLILFVRPGGRWRLLLKWTDKTVIKVDLGYFPYASGRTK